MENTWYSPETFSSGDLIIKAKQAFFLASNLEGYGFHGNKVTILYWTEKYYSLYRLSKTLFFWNQSSTSKVMVI